MSHPAEPSPALFFETINSYQRTALLTSAIELGVFTAIADGAQSPAAIASACAASERGIRIVCDSLTVLGFLTKDNGNYALTQDSALFLNQHSPAYLGGTLEFLLNPTSLRAFENLTEAVRKGGTAIPEEHALEQDHPMWVRFAHSMAPLMHPAAQFMASLVASKGFPLQFKALDIAAGHGVFGVAVAQQCPGAEVVALDWPHVLEVARENAARAGVSDRHRLLPGNAFDVDFGTGYHLILLTNFLHHFDEAGCETLLKKIHKALVTWRNGLDVGVCAKRGPH